MVPRTSPHRKKQHTRRRSVKRGQSRQPGLLPPTAWRHTRLHPQTLRPRQHPGRAYGQFLYHVRWLLLAAWLLVLAVSLPFAGSLAPLLHNSGYVIAGSESNRVNTLLRTTLHHPVSQVILVFQSAHVPVQSPQYRREVQDLRTHIKTLPHVVSVIQGGVGKDGKTTFVTLGFDIDQDAVSQQLVALRAMLPHQNAPAQVLVTGDAAITNEIQTTTQTDSTHAEMLGLPITFIVLMLVFGTVLAGLLPLVLAAVTVLVSLAIIYAIALHVDTNIFVLDVASIIGLGLSIDYSLFIVRRFREELAHGHSVRDAISQTILTAGEAVLFSGLCVIVGFSGLFFVGIPVMSSFALGGITVATIAVLAALTLLPAILSLLGTRINALPLPRLLWWRKQNSPRQSFWRTWAQMVLPHPIAVIVLVTTLLLGIGWPALSLNPGLPGVSALPQHSEAHQGLTLLTTQFPEVEIDPLEIIVQTRDGSAMLQSRNLDQLQHLSQRLASLPHVAHVTDLLSPPPQAQKMLPASPSLTTLYRSGAYRQNPLLTQLVTTTTSGPTTLITIQPTRSDSQTNQALLDQIRALHTQPALTLSVGGSQALTVDFDRVLYGNFLRALLFILLTTYLLLLILFRSIILPLKAILMNMLSVGAAYGVLVIVFQQGLGQTLLHFSSDGSIDRFIPVLLFCVLFGLSMDYEVFLLSRIQEEWKRTGKNQTAIVHGIEHTGGIITHAALLFVIVSASFVTTSLVVTQELGLGITVAILIDASLIRSLLVPAMMQVMGRWNWWFPTLPTHPQSTLKKGAFIQ